MKYYKRLIITMLFICLFILGGCGVFQNDNEVLQSVDPSEGVKTESVITESGNEILQSSDLSEDVLIESDSDEERIENNVTEEYNETDMGEENKIIAVYNDGEIIDIYNDDEILSVSENMMVAEVTPEEILRGNLILYSRYNMDGWVFEWLISDYDGGNNVYLDEAVLVISPENDARDTQIIHVTSEGLQTYLGADKFKYIDVNFDDIPDLLIMGGRYGAQGMERYFCFLQTEDGFMEVPDFAEIPNPRVDAENRLILSTWRNSAVSHSWAEYSYQNNTYVMERHLREDLLDADNRVWIWYVNDEEIGRSDELSETEIDDLLYNENSEWKLSDSRWENFL